MRLRFALWDYAQPVAVIRQSEHVPQPRRIAGFRWNIAKCQLSIGCQRGPLEYVAMLEHTTDQRQVSLLGGFFLPLPARSLLECGRTCTQPRADAHNPRVGSAQPVVAGRIGPCRSGKINYG